MHSLYFNNKSFVNGKHNQKALCHNHRKLSEGGYAYIVNNAIVDRKHQRFYCYDCIKKYNLSPYLVS